jgi:hypothetical protein
MSSVTPVKTLRFDAFRRFEESRKQANNSMIALLIATRIGAHVVDANAQGDHLLPSVFPAVVGIDLLNLTPVAANNVLDGAERHLAFMAIPFVQSIFEELLDGSLRLAALDGFKLTKVEKSGGLIGRIDAIERFSGHAFKGLHRELLNFMRVLRNQIVHEAGRAAASVDDVWDAMSAEAQAEWTSVAQRAFRQGSDGRGLQLDSGEFVAALAIVKRLSREVCGQLLVGILPSTWEQIQLADFANEVPRGLSRRPTLGRELASFSRRNYAPVAFASHADASRALKAAGV